MCIGHSDRLGPSVVYSKGPPRKAKRACVDTHGLVGAHRARTTTSPIVLRSGPVEAGHHTHGRAPMAPMLCTRHTRRVALVPIPGLSPVGDTRWTSGCMC
ncbi:hypothetical protein AMTR_s00097p00019310 [Amborella trichopoda]|uniref:Uncharacterized protein n=1 Tax=Amborella trichopoda TaxID=13333 RepID=W1P274_AMBTC|nr:hypothetical protein AMTR_s00097p00019310 [Amborella trichopoda]